MEEVALILGLPLTLRQGHRQEAIKDRAFAARPSSLTEKIEGDWRGASSIWCPWPRFKLGDGGSVPEKPPKEGDRP